MLASEERTIEICCEHGMPVCKRGSLRIMHRNRIFEPRDSCVVDDHIEAPMNPDNRIDHFGPLLFFANIEVKVACGWTK
jgi:hypothetical protein